MLLSNLFSQRVSRCYRVTTPLIELYARTISSKMSSSVPPSDRASEDIETFHQFSLQSDIQRALSDLNYSKPTPVQAAVIPMLLRGENLVMAAATGSGKTLTYVLPIVDALKRQEAGGYKRLQSRPRCLILVPTRDLARQVLGTVKSISHYAKLSSCAVLGGEPYSLQTKMLKGMVDVVVASPGRLLQHKEQGNVYFGHVSHVIIDEVDTMLTQGFGSDIRSILQSTALHSNKTTKASSELGKAQPPGVDVNGIEKLQVIMASATITKPVRALLSDIEGFDIKFSDLSRDKAIQPTKKAASGKAKPDDSVATKIDMKIVEVSGFHKSLPNVRHSMEDIKGRNKLLVLDEVIQSRKSQKERTMIFCNTIDSCRAAAYHLEGEDKEHADKFVSYHGELNSAEREANLQKFRDGESQFLVCTDLAARGLDIPSVDHIVMFDFPLNPIDYLHRSGRTGRAGRPGRVTALVAKRDHVLAKAIQTAISKNLPLDQLSSSKRDYQPMGKLAALVGKGVSKRGPFTRSVRPLIGGRERGHTSGSPRRVSGRSALMKRGPVSAASTSRRSKSGSKSPGDRDRTRKTDARRSQESHTEQRGAGKVSSLRSTLMSKSLRARRGQKGTKTSSRMQRK